MPFHLLLRNLSARPIRSLLTLGALVVAVFLLCVLRSVVVALDAGVQASASHRLMVQSAVSLFVDLPRAYQSRIATVEGVERVCKFQWFGGIYQDPANFFGQFGVDPAILLEAYPEVEIIDGSAEDFIASRTGCLVGEGLVRRFGWEIGQRIPLQGTIFPRADGSAWEFDIKAVFHSDSANIDPNTMYFDYEYLAQSIESGEAQSLDGTTSAGVGVYVVDIGSEADATQVMADIDTMFENGPQCVQTTTESEFQRQFVTMLGSVPTLLGSIGGGVLFAILLAVVNTMLLAARERTHDLGVMKALGFGDLTAFALLLCESVLLCGLGGAVGVGLAKLAEAPLSIVLGPIFPGFAMRPEILIAGFAVAVTIGLVAGLVPAWAASRLRPVEALRSDA